MRFARFFLRQLFQQPIERDTRKYTRKLIQNVLFEAGFALAKYENQTVLVSVGKLRPFSDIQGKHVLRMDGSPAKRAALAQRLKSTGLEVDMDGSDWLTEGDFSIDESSKRKTRSK